jgi:hypothetical protein
MVCPAHHRSHHQATGLLTKEFEEREYKGLDYNWALIQWLATGTKRRELESEFIIKFWFIDRVQIYNK